MFADGIKTVTVTEVATGEKIRYGRKRGGIAFATRKGGVYELKGFATPDDVKEVRNLSAEWKVNGVRLRWSNRDERYAIYRAVGNDKKYKLLTVTDSPSFTDEDFSLKNKARLTYKVVVAKGDYSQKSQGKVVFLSPATKLEEERYERRLKVNNMYAKDWKLR